MVKTSEEVLADLQGKLLGIRTTSSETVVSYPYGNLEKLIEGLKAYGDLVNKVDSRKITLADALFFAQEHFRFAVRRDTVSIRLGNPQEGRGVYSVEKKTSEYFIWIMPTEVVSRLDGSFTIKVRRHWADNVSSITTYYEFTVKPDGSISLDKEEEVHR
ncbi:MAG: hypothetical protein Q4A34_03870 [Candidatus Saccharibacteria bacterium]|nr:hypothetical protein [Candidatus Saccharibacteria bacterium]